MKYYIGLGSNLGDKTAYLKKALQLLGEHSLIQIRKVSSFYETAPWGNKEQPSFLNAVCEIDTNMLPHELLMVTQDIERQCERVRHEHWGPRTLDLDILSAFSEEEISMKEERLTIPHPYIWDRLFVLIPLAEIAPLYKWQEIGIKDRIAELVEEEEILPIRI